MKKIQLLSLVLAVIFCISSLAACSSNVEEKKVKEEKTTEGAEKALDSNNESKEKIEDSTTVPYRSLTAKKIGTIDKSVKESSINGHFYQDSDTKKYGLINHDGTSDTGAIYPSCKSCGRYFTVSTDTPNFDYDRVITLNTFALVDAEGKELIPEMYAYIELINYRYARAIEVTEVTESDDYLVYFSSSSFNLTAGEDDVKYKGIWYLYDLETGKRIEGATGTDNSSIDTYGECVRFKHSNGSYVTLNAKGEELDSSFRMLTNGYYTKADGNNINVYDENGNSVFSVSSTDYKPSSGENDYIIANKSVDGATKYVLLDLKGNIVSPEFDYSIDVVGNFIKCNKELYNFDGEKVYNGNYDLVTTSYLMPDICCVQDGKKYSFVTTEGDVLYSAYDGDSIKFNSSAMSVYKKEGNNTLYYSFADKDFVIKGSAFNNFLVKETGDNSTYNLVDTLNGETLLEGYSGYTLWYSSNAKIYVKAQLLGGGCDLYEIG